MNKLLTLLVILTLSTCSHRLSHEEQLQYDARYTKAQNAVSNWIKKHALYPNSYESVAFSEYSESVGTRNDEKNPNTENYVIKHTHKILDKDSNLTTFSGYFILEYNYSVNIIETVRSNSIVGSYPPQTQVWTDKYGRLPNRQDSIDLDKQQEQVTDKILNDLKSGLKKGDIYTEDPKDMDKLKNLLDTLGNRK